MNYNPAGYESAILNLHVAGDKRATGDHRIVADDGVVGQFFRRS